MPKYMGTVCHKQHTILLDKYKLYGSFYWHSKNAILHFFINKFPLCSFKGGVHNDSFGVPITFPTFTNQKEENTRVVHYNQVPEILATLACNVLSVYSINGKTCKWVQLSVFKSACT